MPLYKDLGLTDHFAHRKYFISLGGFDEREFDRFVKENQIPLSPEGWPTYEVMRHLCNRVYKREVLGVEQELKREQMYEKRIKNQVLLGKLIDVEVAKNRMKTTLTSLANLIRHAIKSSAPRVALVTNARDAENVMIDAYNNTLKFLGESAKNVDWELEGRNHKLGRTELADAPEENSGD